MGAEYSNTNGASTRGSNEHEACNATNSAFTTRISKVGHEFEESKTLELRPVENKNTDTFDISQFVNIDIIDNSSTYSNSTTPKPLSSRIVDGFDTSSRADTPSPRATDDMGQTCSQNILGVQHMQTVGIGSTYMTSRERAKPSGTCLKNVHMPISDAVGGFSTQDRMERPPSKKKSRICKVKTCEEVTAKRQNYLARNRLAAKKCRDKKNEWIRSLEERAEFFNAERLREIEQTMIEVRYLRAIVAEHCSVCPNPSAELVACFGNEELRLQQQKSITLDLYSCGQVSPLLRGMDYKEQEPTDKHAHMDLGSLH